jgi:hypothetical protein
MAHQTQHTRGMESPSKNLELHPSITAEQYEDSSHKLYMLQATIDIIAGPQADRASVAEALADSGYRGIPSPRKSTLSTWP